MERLLTRGPIPALFGVALGGTVLRAIDLDRHWFWIDEALILNVSALRLSALEYARSVWSDTTYNPGWPLLVWGFLRTFGDNLFVARLPSLLAGALTIPAVYWAARAIRLDRATALMAAFLTAFSWMQVTHSRQVLPYQAVPLLTAIAIGLVGSLSATRAGRLRVLALHLGLVITCVVCVAIHNSFLLTLPMLVLFLGLGLFQHQPAQSVANGPAPRFDVPSAGRVALAALTLALILGPAYFFYVAKSGEGFRDYLGAYYLTTFRTSVVMNPSSYLFGLDNWYKATIPSVASPLQDIPYFVATRTIDWLGVILNPRFTFSSSVDWVLFAFPAIGLFVFGGVSMLRGKGGRLATVLGLCGAASLLFTILLNFMKMYPYGGLRQMLPLAPFATLATAFGARRLFALFPRATRALAVSWVAVALLSIPNFYAQTRRAFDERTLHELTWNVQARAIVAGDGWWSFLPLQYLSRARNHTPEIPVLFPFGPAFDALVQSRQPFVIISLSAPALCPDSTHGGWQVAPGLKGVYSAMFDVRDYHVKMLKTAVPDGLQPTTAFIVHYQPVAAAVEAKHAVK